MDVEDAYIEGHINEEIYVKFPFGIEYVENKMKNMYGKLIKSIYGLVKASHQFYQEISNFLTETLNFTKSLIYP